MDSIQYSTSEKPQHLDSSHVQNTFPLSADHLAVTLPTKSTTSTVDDEIFNDQLIFDQKNQIFEDLNNFNLKDGKDEEKMEKVEGVKGDKSGELFRLKSLDALMKNFKSFGKNFGNLKFSRSAEFDGAFETFIPEKDLLSNDISEENYYFVQDLKKKFAKFSENLKVDMADMKDVLTDNEVDPILTYLKMTNLAEGEGEDEEEDEDFVRGDDKLLFDCIEIMNSEKALSKNVFLEYGSSDAVKEVISAYEKFNTGMLGNAELQQILSLASAKDLVSIIVNSVQNLRYPLISAEVFSEIADTKDPTGIIQSVWQSCEAENRPLLSRLLKLIYFCVSFENITDVNLERLLDAKFAVDMFFGYEELAAVMDDECHVDKLGALKQNIVKALVENFQVIA